MSSPTAAPTSEQLEDFLLACRYGELEEVQAFTQEFGWEATASARDERGNSALHMCCGNGHVDILHFLLPHVPPTLLSLPNEAGSPPIHWAVLNNHVDVVRILSELPEDTGGGLHLLHQKNRAGRDAFAEALFAGEGKEEVAGWIEGFLWRAEGGEEGEEEEAKSGMRPNGVKEGDKIESGGHAPMSGEVEDASTRKEGDVVKEIVQRTEGVALQ